MRQMKSLSTIRRFCQDCRGLAALEFALIAPVMVLIFFGVVEGSDALSASRKVSLSANTLADLVAQETRVGTNDLDDLFIGMEDIISSRDIAVTFTVVSLVYNTATSKVEVDWSYDSDGTTPYAQGSEYTGLADATLLDSASSLVVGEVEYDYTSNLTKNMIKSIKMERGATRWPRRSSGVALCGTVCT
jgi:Flp pilus assembly protein TadG